MLYSINIVPFFFFWKLYLPSRSFVYLAMRSSAPHHSLSRDQRSTHMEKMCPVRLAWRHKVCSSVSIYFRTAFTLQSPFATSLRIHSLLPLPSRVQWIREAQGRPCWTTICQPSMLDIMNLRELYQSQRQLCGRHKMLGYVAAICRSHVPPYLNDADVLSMICLQAR